MPKNAAQFPLIGSFIGWEMALTSVATMAAVGVMMWHSYLQVELFIENFKE